MRPGSEAVPLQINPAAILDRDRPERLSEQIRRWMLGEIEAGRWPVHFKLPAEEELARRLGVNRGTLRKAIAALTAERRLAQIHGKGTFVISPDQVEGPLADQLIAFSEELILQKIPFTTEVLEQRVLPSQARVTAFLGLPAEAEVFHLKRRRFVDGTPIILTDNYVRRDLCPGIEREEFTEQRLFACLERRHSLRLSWSRRVFEARAATPEQAELLALPAGAPLMYIEQIVYLEDGRPVECSDVWLRGDRFRLSATMSRHEKQSLTSVLTGRPRERR
jgi:GntR family transcriptional regulator